MREISHTATFTYPEMVLKRNESVVIIVNTCIRIGFNKCAVESVFAASILTQSYRARLSAALRRLYGSC